jgi:hypothetical protein
MDPETQEVLRATQDKTFCGWDHAILILNKARECLAALV